jgi:hypothetical protein
LRLYKELAHVLKDVELTGEHELLWSECFEHNHLLEVIELLFPLKRKVVFLRFLTLGPLKPVLLVVFERLKEPAINIRLHNFSTVQEISV